MEASVAQAKPPPPPCPPDWLRPGRPVSGFRFQLPRRGPVKRRRPRREAVAPAPSCTPPAGLRRRARGCAAKRRTRGANQTGRSGIFGAPLEARQVRVGRPGAITSLKAREKRLAGLLPCAPPRLPVPATLGLHSVTQAHVRAWPCPDQAGARMPSVIGAACI